MSSSDRADNTFRSASFYLIGSFFLFRLFIMGRTGLGDSESYYWAWGQRLDFSYYDHPPLTAWLIRIFTDIGADTSFWVRFPSALLFVVIGLLFYRLSIDLFDDERVAFHSILLFNLIPMFGIGALQMVPDIPSATCFLAYIVVLQRLLNGASPKLWYLLGALIGIGMLGKYFAVLLIPSTLILVAIVPEYRFWFKRLEPYMMAPVALIFFSPVIIWNLINDWPSFRFHLADRHQGAAFDFRNIEQLVGGQLLYVSPILLVLLVWAVVVGIKRAKEGDMRYALLASFSAPILIFFYIVCAWTNESEPHWPAFGYMTASVILAALLVEWSGKVLKRTYYVGIGLASAIFVLFYIHLFYPILPIKPKYDLVNELVGWEEVGDELFKQSKALSEKNIDHVAMAHHWVLCSQMMFATQDKIPVACINSKIDQFDFWDNEDSLKGKSVIFVSDLRFEEPPDQLYNFSGEVKKVAEIPIERGEEIVRLFSIWRADGFEGKK